MTITKFKILLTWNGNIGYQWWARLSTLDVYSQLKTKDNKYTKVFSWIYSAGLWYHSWTSDREDQLLPMLEFNKWINILKYLMNKQWNIHWGRAGGHLVCVLAFYFDDPSSNPTEVYSLYSENCLKGTKKHEKRPKMAL